jgi:NAD(P)H-dependent FMN reductase
MNENDNDVKTVRTLAISGSLRSRSSNTSLLRAAEALASENHRIVIYEGIGDLPHFNPDIEGDDSITSVQDFRLQLRNSDAVIFSSPEYAHGVPGVLKNALDWVVGSGEMVEKPIALFNASPRSTYAQASLLETLTVMSAKIVKEAFVTVELAGKKLDEAGMVSDPEISQALKAALATLETAIRNEKRTAVEG